MEKPVTGQYEYLHRSGVGLDYFTSRVDRLILFANGRFTLITQDRSRVVNAAQSLAQGQQMTPNAPETRSEGNYSVQGNTLSLHYDGGSTFQGQLSWNGTGVQLGPNFFNKVSDSTMLPPTERVKKDMDDIAKGLKIAGAIGGMALKAAKGIHDTIQSTQTPPAGQYAQGTAVPQPNNAASPQASPLQAPAPGPQVPSTPPYAAPVQPVATPQNATNAPLFCDQCGARVRPGKRFCSQCGARLPM